MDINNKNEFLEAEKREIMAFLEMLCTKEQWVRRSWDTEKLPYDVFPSVFTLSKKIKDSRKKLLCYEPNEHIDTRGIVFLDLFNIHKDCLKEYALMLKSHLPSPSFMETNPEHLFSSTEKESIRRIGATVDTLLESINVFAIQAKAVIRSEYLNLVTCDAEMQLLSDIKSLAQAWNDIFGSSLSLTSNDTNNKKEGEDIKRMQWTIPRDGNFPIGTFLHVDLPVINQ